MKLIFAIVHDEDGNKVISELNTAGYSVTKLATTGGFLRSGNMTLLVGVDAEKVDEVIAIIENESKCRKQIMSTPASIAGFGASYSPYPVEVEVGGATIFVLDVEKFEKI